MKRKKIRIFFAVCLLLAMTASTAFASTSVSGPRPEYDGYRLADFNGGVYLIWKGGYKSFIPNADTYNNLFRNWEGIHQAEVLLNQIPATDTLSKGAMLIRGSNSTNVYLLTNGYKHFIVSVAVMDKYNFDWDKVQTLSQIIVDSIPDGVSIR